MSKQEAEYHFPPVERVLTDLEVFRIAGELRSGCGTPEQAREHARALMAQFVASAYTVEGPSRELVAFVRDALAEHLRTGKSLEAAFRLKKGHRGRPKVDDVVYIELATDLLRYRLESGSLHEDAVAHVREKKHKGRTVVTDAWTNYRENALVRLRDERLEAARKEAEKTAYGDQPLTGDEPHIDLVIGPLWTPGETKILRSIYPDGPL